jgi:hypothetical protein
MRLGAVNDRVDDPEPLGASVIAVGLSEAPGNAAALKESETVPEKPETLARLMVDCPVPPRDTVIEVGFAPTLKSPVTVVPWTCAQTEVDREKLVAVATIWIV